MGSLVGAAEGDGVGNAESADGGAADSNGVGDAEGSCEGTADVGRIVRMEWFEKAVSYKMDAISTATLKEILNLATHSNPSAHPEADCPASVVTAPVEVIKRIRLLATIVCHVHIGARG